MRVFFGGPPNGWVCLLRRGTLRKREPRVWFQLALRIAEAAAAETAYQNFWVQRSPRSFSLESRGLGTLPKWRGFKGIVGFQDPSPGHVVELFGSVDCGRLQRAKLFVRMPRITIDIQRVVNTLQLIQSLATAIGRSELWMILGPTKRDI